MIVKLNRMGVTQICDITLRPGVNTVNAASFKKAMEHPVVKAMHEDGLFEVVEQGNKKEDVDNILKNMSVLQSKETIEATTDLDLLNGWRDVESRSTILRAIDKQIALIKAPTEFRDDNDKKD